MVIKRQRKWKMPKVACDGHQPPPVFQGALWAKHWHVLQGTPHMMHWYLLQWESVTAQRNLICSSTQMVSELRKTHLGCNIHSELAWNQTIERRCRGEAGPTAVSSSGFPTGHATEEMQISCGENSSVARKATAELSVVHDSWKKFLSQISVWNAGTQRIG